MRGNPDLLRYANCFICPFVLSCLAIQAPKGWSCCSSMFDKAAERYKQAKSKEWDKLYSKETFIVRKGTK